MTNSESDSHNHPDQNFGNHPLGEDYQFEELTRDLGFTQEEIDKANVRSYLEYAQLIGNQAVIDIFGLPEEQCSRCGMINVPPENMTYPCPHFHA